MNSIICLDKKYSTTRLVTKEKPHIVNNPNDKLKKFFFFQQSKAELLKVDLEVKDIIKDHLKTNLLFLLLRPYLMAKIILRMRY